MTRTYVLFALVSTLILLNIVACTPDEDDMVVSLNSKDETYYYADYGEEYTLTCTYPHAGLQELQLGLIWGNFSADEFIIFAIAMNYDSVRPFTMEHILKDWVKSADYKISGENITVSMTFWHVFSVDTFDCRAVPTADAPWVSKMTRFNSISLTKNWIWVNTTSISKESPEHTVYFSCPSVKTTSFGMKRSSVSSPGRPRLFNGVFPLLRGTGFSEFRPGSRAEFSYEPDGMYRWTRTVYRVDFKPNMTKLVYELERNFKEVLSPSTTTTTGVSVPIELPIIEKTDDMVTYMIANSTALWNNEILKATCEVNLNQPVTNVDIMLQLHKRPDQTIGTVSNVKANSPSTTGDLDISKSGNNLIIDFSITNTYGQLSAKLICLAKNGRNQLDNMTIDLTFYKYSNPMRSVTTMTLRAAYPSISGKVKVTASKGVKTTSVSAKIFCNLNGHAAAYALWTYRPNSSLPFRPVSRNFYKYVFDTSYPDKRFELMITDPEVSDSGTYKCTLLSSDKKASRWGETVFTVTDDDDGGTGIAAQFKFRKFNVLIVFIACFIMYSHVD